MVRSVEAAILIFLVVPSSSVTRTVLKFGRNLLLVLLFAWLTLLPTIGPLPVIAHFLAISISLEIFCREFYTKKAKELLNLVSRRL